MATVLFVEASGAEHRIDVPTGENLMRAALNEGLDGMVGECGGGLACATCHCYVEEDWADRLPAPAQTELDMLECTASERRPSSRLSCQIIASDALDGLVVHLPAAQY
ncbi:(2Fe-2S)-binding protein [Sphingobium yanoikuyae]|jgi:2Fe-2S ferredoxin|uniref:(2Fe-2S)-binding protein n=1 Tax=Sphingobium yanoikuyae TaxID=13690 RepID=A0A177JIB3_SPHYA|nr:MULTISPECIES: 2Fe-2S iron-sulfur cluster-binding protein [Sphingobium]RSU67678.1 (2Fe-2S)-binding protein [Sphingomonas sp. S-NIH.Pt3_0716]ATI82202.1 (2Fe-2S)-binding protein [Sphingobium yanoikuyae]OAH40913.1 (2Fe-2S)-binding protein [Sphingobium yanoikuyae]PZU55933.1 MAG: (2Fe-2S)-binding protein [Sphingobium sp.]PZU64443.1 MAG: (2Fe-2S)-binding protein [Sphingobium sp.]